MVTTTCREKHTLEPRRWTAGLLLTSLLLVAFGLGAMAHERLSGVPAAAQPAATPTAHWQAISFTAGQPEDALTQANAFLAGLDPRCQVAPSVAAASNPAAFVFVVTYRC
jgi:hypothetical protein